MHATARTIEPRTHAGRGQGGMTLIEVLIAMMLLGVGVAGTISIQVLAMRDEAIAREDNDASRIARGMLEQIQRMTFADVPSTAGVYQPPAFVNYAGYAVGDVPVQVQTPDGNVADHRVYTVSWRINDVAGQSSLRNVDLQIAWIDAAQRPQTYTASTLKYDQ